MLVLALLLMTQVTTNAQSQLWGLTNNGGHQFGTIFSIAPGATTLSNQIDLPGNAGQSSNLLNLVQGSDGGLYGMTPGGGVWGNGIIFRYDPATDAYIEKINLNSTTGDLPTGSLVKGTDGKFYGMTGSGGANGVGVIFQYDAVSNTFNKLYDFEDATGSQPQGSLIQAVNGKLYGMTQQGGYYSSGVLFSLDIATITYTDLFDFNGTDGTFPVGNLMQASDGNLYGMTNGGGADPDGYLNFEQGFGVLFQYDIINSQYTKKIDLAIATGKWPTGSLFQASDGFIYGMTNYGGPLNSPGYDNGGQGYGVMFKYDFNANTYTDIFNFNSTDGSNPYGAFIQALDGNLYAMTNSGGINNLGTIFKYDFTNAVYTKKVDLTTDGGSLPQGSLMQTSDGKFYGFTNHGGNVFSAVLFQYDAGTNSYVSKKQISYSEGSRPSGSFIQATDGKLYGLTSSGGAFGNGVLFQFDPVTHTYTDEVDLLDPTGDTPFGSLVQASDGYLYGMNNYGGANLAGVIFRYDPVSHDYTDLYDLSDASGDFPYGNLIQGTDGKLYGMALGGGQAGEGVIFRFDPTTSALSTAVDLSDEIGSFPTGSLVQASNGMMYGMTSSGGTNSAGGIFLFNPTNNTYNLLVSLEDATGDFPTGSMIQGTDGNLYGLTGSGGLYGFGVLFKYHISSNAYTELIDLTDATGSYPGGSLIQALNGKIYGTTSSGGANGAGVVFQYDPSTNTYSDMYNFNYLDGYNPLFGNLIEICTPPDAPILSASVNPICPGSSTTLSINGNLNSATSWQW